MIWFLVYNILHLLSAGIRTSPTLYGRSDAGEQAVITAPVARGLKVSFISALSAKGFIELRVRSPVAASNKKRKLASETNAEKVSRGTTANHFYDFVKSVIQKIENNDKLKGMRYLILDSAAIHKRYDLQLLVALSGLELACLPPFSPGLNAIQKFWPI